MSDLVRICLRSANRAWWLAYTATDDESRAYWTASQARWLRLWRLAVEET